jgi:hypothetical protein
MTNKAQRAADMHQFIVNQLAAGRTVYLQTALRTTVLKTKHLPMVRVHNGALEIQSGGKWLDYTYTQLTAQ